MQSKLERDHICEICYLSFFSVRGTSCENNWVGSRYRFIQETKVVKRIFVEFPSQVRHDEQDNIFLPLSSFIMY